MLFVSQCHKLIERSRFDIAVKLSACVTRSAHAIAQLSKSNLSIWEFFKKS